MSVYTEAAERVPGLAEYLHGPFDLPASAMTDADWLRERIADTGRRWNCTDDRINGTLWWYSASSTIALLAVSTAMVTGTAADPSLEHSRCFLRGDGYLGGVRSDRTVTPEQLPGALASTFRAVVDALAAASGATTNALWAITSDSIANRCLDVGTALGDRERGSAFAQELVAAMSSPLPAPRFVDVGGRRFTRRSSCCLLYLTSASDKCTSCPRRTPSDRLRGLRAAAQY